MVKLDRFNGSCKILDDPSDRIREANKTEDINLNVFNKIAQINK